MKNKFLSGALSFFVLFMITCAVSSSFFFFAKEAKAQSCAGGASSCGIQVCGSGSQNVTDSVCGGRNCCVPNTAMNNGCVGSCMISGCAGFSAGFGTCTGADAGKSCCSTQPAPTQPPPGAGGTGDSGELVPCGNQEGPEAAQHCQFNHFIELVQRVMKFLLFVVAVPFAAISFAWAGWLYLSAAGNESKVKEAHQIFGAVALGLCLALAAYLIVEAIIKGLGVADQYNFLGG